MSLFAKQETIKIYLDEKGNISKKETPTWLEVLKELPYALKEQANKAMKISHIEQTRNGNMVMDISNLEEIPIGFLTKVIKSWSEDVPITRDNLKNVKYQILANIWGELVKLYGLSGNVARV